MYLYILGTIAVIVVTTLLVFCASIKPSKGAIRISYKDRNSLPSLMSRIPLVLLGAMFKKEGRLYPGFKEFPETHIEIGSSEYVRNRRWFKADEQSCRAPSIVDLNQFFSSF